VLDLSKEKDRKILDAILSVFRNIDVDRPWFSQMESREHILSRTKGRRLITDDNMVSEWAQREF
jgi:23S rRNA U2552 (ribose-2'-O)-methylase RlmE/FtsJ